MLWNKVGCLQMGGRSKGCGNVGEGMWSMVVGAWGG